MLNGKQIDKRKFETAKELRDWLNSFTDRELNVIYVESDETGEPLTVRHIENDMEDGSFTYDLLFR